LRLEFSGSPEIAAPRDRVWRRLIDPHFVAGSAPGIESLDVIDPTHFRMTSSVGIGVMRARLTMDGELSDLVTGTSARMLVRGKGAGSTIEVVSAVAIKDAGVGRVRLEWTATTELSGTITRAGGRLVEGIARKLTEEFWEDFARRVTEQ